MSIIYCAYHHRQEDSDETGCVVTDDGTEYCNEGFDEMLDEAEEAAKWHDCPPDNPWEMPE